MPACPECRTKFSASARSCPKCGFTVVREGGEDEPERKPSRGCVGGIVSLLVAAVLLVGALLGAAYLLWGKKPGDTVKDLMQGRVTLYDKKVELSASSVGVYPFTAAPGGTVEVTVAIQGRGELNLRVLDDIEFLRLEAAKKPLEGADAKPVPAFTAEDFKATRTVRGKLGAGKFHVVLHNENLFAGVEAHLTVVQDYGK